MYFLDVQGDRSTHRKALIDELLYFLLVAVAGCPHDATFWPLFLCVIITVRMGMFGIEHHRTLHIELLYRSRSDILHAVLHI